MNFIRVPPGARSMPCSGCGATMYWILTKNGKAMPVDCDTKKYGPETRRPSLNQEGLGVSHYATCPKADTFRRSRP